jgi:HlyD family secretion protein
MDMPTSGKEIQSTEAPPDGQEKNPRAVTRTPSIVVGIVAAIVVALSVFYLLRREPLLVQGEADATRLDIAARVDGRVKEIPVERGQNVPAGAVLVRIDNPETLAKHGQMKAAMAVAEAQLANVLAGTRAETIAARKAELERAQAALVLAQKTFDRTNTLTEQGNAPQSRLDQVTDTLHESERAVDQARSAHDQAINGYTKEERDIARTNVEKANADIQAVQSLIDQLVIYAPVASQVYQRNVEPGEYVSPGVPLVTLIDLADVWIHFDLREDLVKSLKVGDRFDVRIPALADRLVAVEVKLIATKAAGIASSGLSDTLSAAAAAAAPAKRAAPAPASIGTLSGETIALVNPQKNYAQFLLRALLPMIIHVVITLAGGYAVGSEFRRRNAREWLESAGGDPVVALVGKLAPLFGIFFLIMLAEPLVLEGVRKSPSGETCR